MAENEQDIVLLVLTIVTVIAVIAAVIVVVLVLFRRKNSSNSNTTCNAVACVTNIGDAVWSPIPTGLSVQQNQQLRSLTDNCQLSIDRNGNCCNSTLPPLVCDNNNNFTTSNFYDDFSNGFENWYFAHTQWGGNNGGVSWKNVSLGPDDSGTGPNVCILQLQGNAAVIGASGANPGVKLEANNTYQCNDSACFPNCSIPTETTSAQYVGACIVSRLRFASGSYEITAKIPAQEGVVYGFWTFHYQEHYPPPYNKIGPNCQPNSAPMYIEAWQVGCPGCGYYSSINHEIDWEIPGGDTMSAGNFSTCNYNSWIGDGNQNGPQPCNDAQYCPPSGIGCQSCNGPKGGAYEAHQITYKSINQADGNYHKFRWDWHTGLDDGDMGHIDFYIDEIYVYTLNTYVPRLASRLWIGGWFGRSAWVGTPNFDVIKMYIKSVKITPFGEKNDMQHIENYDYTGQRCQMVCPDGGTDCLHYGCSNPAPQMTPMEVKSHEHINEQICRSGEKISTYHANGIGPMSSRINCPNCGHKATVMKR